MSGTITQTSLKKIKSLSKFKKSITYILILIITIALLEIFSAINNSTPNWFKEYENNNEIGISFNLDVLEANFYSFQTVPHVQTKNFDKAKSDSVKRVFIIGDASPSGWPYSANQSLARKVEAIFNKCNLDNELELIPICFAGNNSDYIVEIIQDVIEYGPDLIIIFLGHNEIYKHSDLVTNIGSINSNFLDFINRLSYSANLKQKHAYNNKNDDFEILLPKLVSSKVALTEEKQMKVTENFHKNLNEIVEIFNSKKLQYIIPIITDNLLLPPTINVESQKDLHADIIFNNARMALYRDGNVEKAKELFIKTKELDELKVRIPESIKNVYKKILIDENAIVRIDSLFEMESDIGIPSDDLFLDYIHPNNDGLNLIAITLVKEISNKLNLVLNHEDLFRINKIAENTLKISTLDSNLVSARLSDYKANIYNQSTEIIYE